MPRRGALALALLLALGGAARGDDAETRFREARAYYEERIDRPPLGLRIGGIRRLAATRDPRALLVLAQRYAKPRVPKDHERYLIAAELGRWFTREEDRPALERLLRDHHDDADAWLWFQALAAASHDPDAGAVTQVVADAKRSPFLRAAALERLAATRSPAALALLPALLDGGTLRKGLPRALLLEAASSVLLAWQGRPEARALAARLVDVLASDDVAERTKLVVARRLAVAYGVDRVTLDHAWWRRLLASEGAAPAEGHTVAARPRFFGVEASGTRVAYLIDLSDSMLEPLTDLELLDARDLHVVGADGADALDGARIRNRFDLARAYLRASLQQLGPDVCFVVVAFGSEAQPLRATKGLVRATRANVAAAVRELDAVEPGRATPTRPYGTLRGNTNLHAALLRAFRSLPDGWIDAAEHVDEKGLWEGCDTIFVLSDGAPTQDDFDAQDRFAGGALTADRERGGTTSAPPGSATYFGPYAGVPALLEDVERMNLLRKVEIHAIAMGEAEGRLMRGLAERGLGRYQSVGMLGRGGRLNAWWLLGPFPAPDAAAAERAEAPEQEVALDRPVEIGGRLARWRRTFPSRADAAVTLAAELEPGDGVAASAYA